jgi:diacylglycerol O-acyltransferase
VATSRRRGGALRRLLMQYDGHAGGPIVAGSAMNTTVWSYVDELAHSVLTGDLALGDPHEATEALIDVFRELLDAAGISEAVTQLVGTFPMAAATG